MGDPRKQRKKFSTPSHPWQRERIDSERELRKEYGLKNKKEIWKMDSFIKNSLKQAKKLAIISGTPSERAQAEKETQALLNKLYRYGILAQGAGLDAVLELKVRDVLDRRLSTIIHKNMLANSTKQARQYITHGHILVDGKAITSPSYIVPVKEESLISFSPSSALSDPEHPERVSAKSKEAEESAEKKADGAEAKKEMKKEDKSAAKEAKKEDDKKKAKAEVKAEDKTAAKVTEKVSEDKE